MFQNPSASEIERLLRQSRVIAVLGLSDTPGRPSLNVSRALQGFGYRIVPVNPGSQEILGERSWPDLETALSNAGPVDIVDVFRRPEHVAAIVDDCIRLQVKALWLQEGVVDEAAAQRAREAGIFTVMDRCIYKDRAALATR